LRDAAVGYPSDPAGFLTGVIRTIGDLEKDDRFASLRDTPSAFKTAAISYPSDPAGFLLEEMHTAKVRVPGKKDSLPGTDRRIR
jgi:hypothetical protein